MEFAESFKEGLPSGAVATRTSVVSPRRRPSSSSSSAASECNIGVAVRIRPLSEREAEQQREDGIATPSPVWVVRGGGRGGGGGGGMGNTVAFVGDPAAFGRGGGDERLPTYQFDHVLGPECGTARAYEKLCTKVVDGTLQGFNGTIFAYGQTSSGKTYSMVGNEADPGMAVLAVHDIFTAINRTADSDFLVAISYIEIYNEQFIDLLNPRRGQGRGGERPLGGVDRDGGGRSAWIDGDRDRDAGDREDSGAPGPVLDVFDDKARGPYVRGATELVCCSSEQVLDAMRRGLVLRHMAATDMNLQSSRSHTILRVVVESRRLAQEEQGTRRGRVLQQWGQGEGEGEDDGDREGAEERAIPVCMSSLYLVDLAGSENAGRHSSAVRLKEGSHINKSLLTLSKVINVLAAAQAAAAAKAAQAAQAKEGGATGGDLAAIAELPTAAPSSPHFHVPFRESKLTRLLSGSLGGNARTVLLCCISPSASNADETRSTLQFGERAKRVRNRVRVNEAHDSLLSKYRAEVALLRSRLREAELKASRVGSPARGGGGGDDMGEGEGGAPWSTPRASAGQQSERDALHKLHSLRKLILLSCSTIKSAHPVLAQHLRDAAKGTRRASRVAAALVRGDLVGVETELDDHGAHRDAGGADQPPPPPPPPATAAAVAGQLLSPQGPNSKGRRFSGTLLRSVGQLDALQSPSPAEQSLQGTVYSGFLLRLQRGRGFEEAASLWVLYPHAICCFRSVADAARSNGAAGAVGRFTQANQPLLRPGGKPAEGLAAEGEAGNSKNNLSTLNGCFVPCLLNILGAVLYLRIGFSVGQMGMLATIGILVFSEGVAYLTICSFSAIVTNGRMKGGGAYYMISRNLGAAFGGSSGLLFWITYCINVTFNTVAFTSTFIPTFFPDCGDDGTGWIGIGCSSLTLFILFLVAFKGAGAFASVNIWIFAGLVVSLVTGIGSVFFKPGHKTLDPVTYDGTPYAGDFYPFSWHRADCTQYHQGENSSLAGYCEYGVMHTLYTNTTASEQCNDQECNLASVFAIIFPAVTGMMEGANLSGDLKDPAKSIPLGTLAAVSTAFLCYLLLVIGQAGTLSRTALQYNVRVLQFSCINQYLIVLGVATACLSTALGSMFGSARILQAIARDNLFPMLKPFGKGTVVGDEPRRAVLLTYAIAQCGIFIGSLDQVAPILTNFFLVTYGLTNLATFLLTVSGVVNFRPSFRVFSWQSALLGALLNIAVMLYLNVVYAVCTLAILAVLFVYVAITGPDVEWGDISQALLFQHARSFLLSLQRKPDVRKFWRPSLMLLARTPDAQSRAALVGFCDDLKRDGLFLLSCPLRCAPAPASAPAPVLDATAGSAGCADDAMEVRRVARRLRNLKRLIGDAGLAAFPRIALAPSARLGCQNLMLADGLGGMSASSVVVSEWAEGGGGCGGGVGASSAAEHVSIMRDALALGKNLLLACNFQRIGGGVGGGDGGVAGRRRGGGAPEESGVGDDDGTMLAQDGTNPFPIGLTHRAAAAARVAATAAAGTASDWDSEAGDDPRQPRAGAPTSAVRLTNPWQYSFGQRAEGRCIDVWLLSPRWAWRSEHTGGSHSRIMSQSIGGADALGLAPKKAGELGVLTRIGSGLGIGARPEPSRAEAECAAVEELAAAMVLDPDLSVMLQFAYVLARQREERYDKWWLRLKERFAAGGAASAGAGTGAGADAGDEDSLPRTVLQPGALRYPKTQIRVMQLLPAQVGAESGAAGGGAAEADATARYVARHESLLKQAVKNARVEASVHVFTDADMRSPKGRTASDTGSTGTWVGGGGSTAGAAAAAAPAGRGQPDVASLSALRAECSAVNALVARHSHDTAVSFITMPLIPPKLEAAAAGESALAFTESLAALTADLPPTLLVANGEGASVITTDI
eukprot:g2693.t1